MKKINLSILLLFVLVITACEKETPLRENSLTPANLLPKNLDNPEAALLFLSREMPEVYTPAEISRVKEMLEETPLDNHQRTGATVMLPAGSVDALQAAVEEAGEGGTVMVQAGNHTENGLVTISHRVNIIGEDGAEMTLFSPFQTGATGPLVMEGGIYLKGANRSMIRNIDFKAGNNSAGYCLLIEDSDQSVINGNSFLNFQFNIMVYYSDRMLIRDNQLVGDPTKIFAPISLGIVIINGKSPSLVQNKVSNFIFGIWACDRGGVSWSNETFGNLYGQILCKVPTEGYINPEGVDMGAEDPANHWLIAFNNSHDNLYAGLVAIDGASKNVLLGNTGGNNAAYDVDLVGGTERFGFFTPTSVKNTVWSPAGQTIKDCGEDNKVHGGIMVDTTVDPCDNVE